MAVFGSVLQLDITQSYVGNRPDFRRSVRFVI